MESSVTSQISPKVYTAEVSKLYKDDVDAQSELFEINIFNSTLHIAPGKSISDEDNDKLVYFYVYAIKDDKVVANLGVYELLTDEQKLLYDISTFENLLLFDYYYTNPTKIKEFEITGKNNIFDYIKTHLTYVPIDKALLIYNRFAIFRRDQKESIGSDQLQSIYKKIIGILSKDIKTKGIDDEKIDQLRVITTNIETLKLTLAILEPFLNVHFSFVDKGAIIDNYRNKTPDQTFTPKQYIIVSTDQTFISTSSTLKEVPKKESMTMGELEEGEIEEGEIEGQPEALKDEGFVKTRKSAKYAEDVEGEIKDDEGPDAPEASEPDEGAVKPKESKKNEKIVYKKPKTVTSTSAAATASAIASSKAEEAEEAKFKFLGRRLPELKSKADAKDSKAETESRVEAKESKAPAKSKTEVKESKAAAKSKAEVKESRAESKAELKAEQKSERKTTRTPSEAKESKGTGAFGSFFGKAPEESKSTGTFGSLFKVVKKPKPSKAEADAKVEAEPTNLEAAGIFNKNYKAPESESKKVRPKPSAPRRQSAKFVENANTQPSVSLKPRPKSATSKKSNV